MPCHDAPETFKSGNVCFPMETKQHTQIHAFSPKLMHTFTSSFPIHVHMITFSMQMSFVWVPIVLFHPSAQWSCQFGLSPQLQPKHKGTSLFISFLCTFTFQIHTVFDATSEMAHLIFLCLVVKGSLQGRKCHSQGCNNWANWISTCRFDKSIFPKTKNSF